MGSQSGFKCNKCNYKVSSVASAGIVMRGELVPYVCTSCREVQDVFFDHSKLIIDENPKCKKCKKEMHTKWDTVKKPCPNCVEGKLGHNPETLFLMID